jgi:hypothetical protein
MRQVKNQDKPQHMRQENRQHKARQEKKRKDLLSKTNSRQLRALFIGE